MNTRGIPNDQTDDERRAKVNAVWSINAERRAEVQGWYWMAHPMVRARLNNLISGNAECDAYCRLGQLLHERGWELPIEHALSLGCGFGNLERDLARRGMVRRVDGYDIAEGAIAEARRLAAEAGLDGIRYHVADLDQLHFEPGTVDVVFAHQSVHHVERLEALYETVQNALRPGGVFHLHEFVGPSRFQWSDTQLGLVNAFLASLPPRLRRLPSGELKPPLRRPTITEMIAADPSEAVRSADIVPTLLLCFDVIEERRIGGTLLHLALGDIAQNFDPESAEDSAWLKASFALEDRAMAEGAIGSDFVIITAMPKNCRQTAQTKTADTKSVSNGSPVPQSKVTSLALHFPAVKRLYAAVRSLIDQAGTLASEQARIWQELMRLSRESAALKTRLDALASEQDERAREAAAAPARVGVTCGAPTSLTAGSGVSEAGLDRFAAREMQSAAVRHLPFLPGEILVTADGIELQGYAGAPEGLFHNMAFFVNGHRFDRVEYPIVDPALAAKFSEVRGMGLVFRARMTQELETLRGARFLRFDASPTGAYVAGNWRQAIHFMNPAHERYPLPPVPNIQRVIGDTSATRFAMGGATIFKNLEAYLGELGHSWADFPRILDWGCGAGRVTRYLLSETDCVVTGADIDPDNVAWCRTAYPSGEFQHVPLRPPTALPEVGFDLVIGLSVLTHLQEDDQWAWLRELKRVTRPGALVFLSVQGPTQFAYNGFSPALYRRLQAAGFIDFSRDPALDAVIGDPEYYRAAMHARSYIVDRWGEYFEVVAIVDAIAALQDYVVLRRKS